MLEPWEVVQLLNRIDGGLVPFLALWCFAAIRKEEIPRLTWQEVNKGLESGSVDLPAQKPKTGQSRSVLILLNLRAWLSRTSRPRATYRRPDGTAYKSLMI